MQLSNSTKVSSFGRVLGISLVTFYTFFLGYTISRALLSQSNPTNNESTSFESVIPHQATLWDAGLSN